MTPYEFLEAEGQFLAPPEHEPTLVGHSEDPGLPVVRRVPAQHLAEVLMVEEMVGRARVVPGRIAPARERLPSRAVPRPARWRRLLAAIGGRP